MSDYECRKVIEANDANDVSYRLIIIFHLQSKVQIFVGLIIFQQ